MSQASQSWDSGREAWQRILNAVPVPPRRAQVTAPEPVACVARVVWERDGVEFVQTIATAWTTRAVLIALRTPRWRLAGVWVPAADVRRLGTVAVLDVVDYDSAIRRRVGPQDAV